MISPKLILHHIPFQELLDDIRLILKIDCEELNRLSEIYKFKEKKEGVEAVEKFRKRLIHFQRRYEFMNHLCVRFQTYQMIVLAKAIEDAKTQAEENGEESYTLLINFTGENYPNINII